MAKSLQFDGTQSASTPYYPSDGEGGWTATQADSFVKGERQTLVYSANVPGSASGAQVIEIYHEDGTLAFKTSVEAQTSPEAFSWPQGLHLIGQWYVEFPSVGSATDFWHLHFEVVA